MNYKNLLLCAVTDRRKSESGNLYNQIEKAIKGGITLLELREEDFDREDRIKEIEDIKLLCRNSEIPFIVRNNIELARKADADGIHLENNNIDIAGLRNIIGKDKILGVTVSNREDAEKAVKSGADYLSIDGKTLKNDITYNRKIIKSIISDIKIPVILSIEKNYDIAENIKDTGICGTIAEISLLTKGNKEDIKNIKKKVQKAVLPEMKGIIFDVDGTLLDTMVIWTDSGARYLKSIGIVPEEHLGDKLFAMTTDGGAEYLKKNYNLPMEIPEIKRGITSMVEKAYYEFADFKPGAKELLEEVKRRNIPMTIASSTDNHLLRAVMDRLGYTDYFMDILSCSDYNTTKSEPKIFYEAIKIMGTEPENTWIFEDGLYSILTGKKAGFRTVGVYDIVSHKDQEEIIKNADIYVEDLTDFELI